MKIFFFSCFALILLSTFAPKLPEIDNMPMCHAPIAEFAKFASDADFRAAHQPDFLRHYEAVGGMVEFPVAGGANGKAYVVKAANETTKYLMIFHEWWGLNNNTKREADEWSKELNINVIAVDLYDGKEATTPDEAGKLMQANDAKRASAIIKGAAKYCGKKATFRTLGWCFGGGWSLQAALQLKKKAKACVMYYGMPEKDVNLLKKLQCNVTFIHASKDQWINDRVVEEFEKNMQAAGKGLAVHRYDADHAFANPTSPRYHEASAKASRQAVKEFLTKKGL
jgi:carboxymethylenebutenolidase